jgi:hypothetical protein
VTTYLLDAPCASYYYEGDIDVGNGEGATLKCRHKHREKDRVCLRLAGGVLSDISALCGSEEAMLTRACVCAMCGAQAVDNRQRIRKPYPKPSTKVARAFKNVVREMKGKCFALGGTDKYAEHDLTWHTRRVISGFAGEKRRLY